MHEQEIMQLMLTCTKVICEGSKPLDPDFAKVVDEEFWSLLRQPTEKQK